jgi:hypothetical protein
MVPHVVWSPGAGLVLELGEIALPAAHPADVTVPEGFARVRGAHLTLLRRRSLAAIVPFVAADGAARGASLAALPSPPPVALTGPLCRAEAPEEDASLGPGPRVSLYLACTGQDALHAYLAAVVATLDARSRAAGGPAFPHPEPDRLFHVSVWNNRGGDPRHSVGGVTAPR